MTNLWRPRTYAVALVLIAALTPRAAKAQSGATLCRVGEPVEYVNAGRRYPGRVEGNNGRNCLVYAKAYMGVIDVAYGDLRSPSGAPEGGKADAPSPELEARGITTVTPREIVDAFRRDPAAAKARLVGRPIRIRTAIHTVDDKSIWLKATLYQTAAVCLVEPPNRDALQQLRAGDVVTVEGVSSDRGDESLFVQNCRVVGQGEAPVAVGGPPRPPAGRYDCRSAGQGVGGLTLAESTYTVEGVTGTMRFDPASRRLTFSSGSYAKWGWLGEWRTDADGVGGPPEPRVVLTDGKSLRVTCTPRR